MKMLMSANVTQVTIDAIDFQTHLMDWWFIIRLFNDDY
jgi:hypothetical protein